MSGPLLDPADAGARRFAVRRCPGRFLLLVVLTVVAAALLGSAVPGGVVSGAVGGAVGLLIVRGGMGRA